MRSLLVHREHPPLAVSGREDARARCVVVALHDEGGDVDQLAGVARSGAPFSPVRAAQAARPRNPAISGSSALPGYAGYAWYRVQEDGRPDPATFEDSLRQIDAFLIDTKERHPRAPGAPARRIVIVAKGQGAALARAAEERRRDLVAGVCDLDEFEGRGRSAIVAEITRLCDLAAGAPTPQRGGLLAGTAAAAAALLACGALLLARDGRAASSGPQPGTTGAPAIGAVAAEMDCTSCHGGPARNPGDGGRIELSGLGDTYEPGKRYTVTFRISHPDPAVARWGFQLTAIRRADGHGAGELVVTDAQRTQRQTGLAGRQYLEHTVPGTAIGQTGGASWSFDWIAPPADVGEIAFFGIGNAANVDGSKEGDRIYGPSPAPLATLHAAAR